MSDYKINVGEIVTAMDLPSWSSQGIGYPEIKKGWVDMHLGGTVYTYPYYGRDTVLSACNLMDTEWFIPIRTVAQGVCSILQVETHISYTPEYLQALVESIRGGLSVLAEYIHSEYTMADGIRLIDMQLSSVLCIGYHDCVGKMIHFNSHWVISPDSLGELFIHRLKTMDKPTPNVSWTPGTSFTSIKESWLALGSDYALFIDSKLRGSCITYSADGYGSHTAYALDDVEWRVRRSLAIIGDDLVQYWDGNRIRKGSTSKVLNAQGVEPSVIRDVANRLRYKFKLQYANTRAEIHRVYVEGPDSCMSKPASYYDTRSDECISLLDKDGDDMACGYIHPSEVYATDDIGVVYIENDDGVIIARATFNKHDKTYPTMYGHGCMDSLLTAGGFEQDCEALIGCNILALHNTHDEYIVPYVDGDNFSVSYNSNGRAGRIIDNCERDDDTYHGYYETGLGVCDSGYDDDDDDYD